MGQYGRRHDEPANSDVKDVESEGLTLIGIVGVQDSMRQESVAFVDKLAAANVNVRLVTSDDLELAKAIAVESNIIHSAQRDNSECCMTGPEFYEEIGGLVMWDSIWQREADAVSRQEHVGLRVRNLENFAKLADKVKVLANARP